MFIRSENLFIRPAWPEDRAALARIAVPSRHDPLRNGADNTTSAACGLIVTLPGLRGTTLIGTAGFEPLRGTWDARIWLAPAWRHLGLLAEAEAALAELAESLPPARGSMPQPMLVAA